MVELESPMPTSQQPGLRREQWANALPHRIRKTDLMSESRDEHTLARTGVEIGLRGINESNAFS